MLILVPLALMLRVRLLLPLAVAGLLNVFGDGNLCCLAVGRRQCACIRISVGGHLPLQCETNNWRRVQQLVDDVDPDVLALQDADTKTLFAVPENWHILTEGQLVLASRYPFKETHSCRREGLLAGQPPLVAIYALMETPSGPLGVCNVQLMSRSVSNRISKPVTALGSQNLDPATQIIDCRSEESRTLAEWVHQLPQVDVVMGNFNLPVESRIYRRWWGGLVNAFSSVGSGLGYTRWYLLHGMRYGARVNHVLLGADWLPVSCEVGPSVGSEHLPVLASITPRR